MHLAAGDLDRSSIRRVDAAEQFDDGGLAGPVFADEADNLAGVDG